MNSILEDLQTQGYALVQNPHSTVQDFVRLSNAWGKNFLSVSGADSAHKHTHRPRQIIGSHLGRTPLPNHASVFLSSGSGSTFPLPLHGELYYQSHSPPEALFFYCQTPPAEAGETMVCNGISLFDALPSPLQERLVSQKISYTRYSPKELWQKDYATQDGNALLAFLAQNHVHGEIDANGELKTVFTTSAVPKVNGKHCFINNLIPFALREHQEPEATRSRVRFENGDAVSPEVLNTILTVAAQQQVGISWQAGDILIVDNRWCMHGRDRLAEGPRTLYLRMAQRIHLEA